MVMVTFRDALDGGVEVAVGLLESKQQVNVVPVLEQLLKHGQLRGVLLLHLAELALVLKIVFDLRCVVEAAIRLSFSASSAASRSASAAAA
jgi:hypothetical protein